MKEKVYATNICLIPDQETYDICSRLNKLDTTSKYNINSRKFIPHATLVMKYLTESQIKQIQDIIEWIETNKIPTITWEYFAEEKNAGGMWSW